MGIPRFFSDFLRPEDEDNLNNEKIVTETIEGEIETLSIDLNSIIHDAAGENYRYTQDSYKVAHLRKLTAEEQRRQIGPDENLAALYANYCTEKDISAATLEINHFTLIRHSLEMLVRKVNPKKLIVAVDGLAPMAKIAQQRKRRYASTPGALFDSNCITPGTPFMKRLDVNLDIFFKSPVFAGVQEVLYSSYTDPGEGEHKIVRHLRSLVPQKNQKGPGGQKGHHVINGVDSDLIVLAMLVKLDNVWVMKGKEYISIRILKNWLLKKYNLRSIEDFAILTFFVGNDFLPKIPHFRLVGSALRTLLKGYDGTSLVSGEGQIRYDKILDILEYALNQNLIEEVIMSDFVIPEPAFEEAKATDRKNLEKLWNKKLTMPRPNDDMLSLMLKFELPDVSKMLQNAVTEFLKGVTWCYQYYTGDPNVSRTWFYGFHYAPYLTTIMNALRNKFEMPEQLVDEEISFNIPEQLFCVIPPKSFGIMDKQYSQFIEKNNLLTWLFPNNVITPDDGIIKFPDPPGAAAQDGSVLPDWRTLPLEKIKRREHERVHLVPFVDLKFLRLIMIGYETQNVKVSFGFFLPREKDKKDVTLSIKRYFSNQVTKFQIKAYKHKIIDWNVNLSGLIPMEIPTEDDPFKKDKVERKVYATDYELLVDTLADLYGPRRGTFRGLRAMNLYIPPAPRQTANTPLITNDHVDEQERE